MADAEIRALARQLADMVDKADPGVERRLQAFEGLMNEVSAALADLVAALQKPERPERMTELVDAIRSLQLRVDAPEIRFEPRIVVDPPSVTVENKVEPTPVQVNVAAPVVNFTMPEREDDESEGEKECTWEVRLPGLYGAPDRVLTITKRAA